MKAPKYEKKKKKRKHLEGAMKKVSSNKLSQKKINTAKRSSVPSSESTKVLGIQDPTLFDMEFIDAW